jgi:hypothetical protein
VNEDKKPMVQPKFNCPDDGTCKANVSDMYIEIGLQPWFFAIVPCLTHEGGHHQYAVASGRASLLEGLVNDLKENFPDQLVYKFPLLRYPGMNN